MYPKLNKKKNNFKKIIGNYIYELKNGVYELLKVMTNVHYLFFFLQKNLHF